MAGADKNSFTGDFCCSILTRDTPNCVYRKGWLLAGEGGQCGKIEFLAAAWFLSYFLFVIRKIVTKVPNLHIIAANRLWNGRVSLVFPTSCIMQQWTLTPRGRDNTRQERHEAIKVIDFCIRKKNGTQRE